MIIQNVNFIKEKVMPAHGGKGTIRMKFFHQEYQRFRDAPDLGTPNPTYNTANWNFFAYSELPVGSTIGPHKHIDNDEIYYILEGSADMSVDEDTRTIKKGDVILTLHGSQHSIQNVTVDLKFIATEILIDNQITNGHRNTKK